jgi:hypothetical protein
MLAVLAATVEVVGAAVVVAAGVLVGTVLVDVVVEVLVTVVDVVLPPVATTPVAPVPPDSDRWIVAGVERNVRTDESPTTVPTRTKGARRIIRR